MVICFIYILNYITCIRFSLGIENKVFLLLYIVKYFLLKPTINNYPEG